MNILYSSKITALILLISGMLFASCDGMTNFEVDEYSAFDLVTGYSVVGGQEQSTVVVEFNDDIQTIDASQIKIRHNDVSIQVIGAFFVGPKIYITVSSTIQENDSLSIIIAQGAVEGLAEEVNPPRSLLTDAAMRQPEMIGSIAVPNSRYIYLLYDSLVSWANMEQFALSSDNAITAATVINTVTSHIQQALASNKYISETNGVTSKAFSRYIVRLTLAKPIAASEDIIFSAGVAAVTSIDGRTLSGEINNIVIGKIDDVFPEFVGIEASSSHNTRIVLVFDEIITEIDAEKIGLRVNDVQRGELSARINPDAKNEVYITVAEPHVIGDSLEVRIDEGAVKNSNGKYNAIATETSLVADSTGPRLQSVTANNGSGSSTVVVHFDEAITQVDEKKFRVSINNKDVTVERAIIDSSESMKVKLTLSTSFDVGDSVQVLLDENAVADSVSPTGNSNVADSTGKITEVFDISLPILQSITANDVDETTVIAIFNRKISSADYKKFRIMINDTVGSITEATIDGDDEKRVQLSLSAALTAGTMLQLTLEAGAVSDKNVADGPQQNVADSNGHGTRVSDMTAPRVLSMSASDKPELIIEFSEVIQVADTKQFTIKNGDVDIKLVDANVRNNTRVSLIAAVPFVPNSILTIIVGAGAVLDVGNNKNIQDATTGQAIRVADVTAPSLRTARANDGTNTQPQLILKFDEPISDVSNIPTDFIVRSAGTSYTVKTITASSSDATEVELKFSDGSRLAETVTVTLKSGAVKDVAGNESITDNTGISATVADVSPPRITAITANDDSNNQNQISVIFNEQLASISTTMSKFIVKVGTTSYAVKSATLDPSKVTVHLKLADGLRLPKDGTVALTLGSEAITDSAGNGGLATTTPVSSTVADVRVPEITAITANDGSNNQNQLTLNFNEKLSSVSTTMSKFIVKVGTTSYEVKSATLDATKTKVHLKLADGLRLPKDGTVAITLGSGAVIDSAGNGGLATTAAVSSTVADVTVPEITAITANDGSNNQNQLTLNFNEKLSSVSTTMSKFTVKVGTTSYEVKSATLDATKTKVHLTLADGIRLPKDGTVAITLGSGAVTDSAGNGGLATTAPVSSTVADVTVPEITAITANDGSNNQNQLTLNFNEKLSSVSTTMSKFTVKVGTTSYEVKSATLDATKTKVHLTLADGVRLPKDGTVAITLGSGAVTDNGGNGALTTTAPVSSTVADVSEPEITAITANDGSNNQNQLTLNFNEKLSSISTTMSKFIVKVGTTSYEVKSATLDATKTKVHLTLADGVRLPKDGTVAITLGSGAVTDSGGNGALTTTAPVSSTVADVSEPEITAITANDGSNNQNQLTLNFNEKLSSISTTMSQFIVKVGTTSYEVKSATLDATKTKVHLTLADGVRLPKDGTVAITLGSGAVTDSGGNGALTTTAPVSSTVADVSPPEIESIQATVDNFKRVIVTFTEEVTVVDASKFKVNGVEVLAASSSGEGASKKIYLTVVEEFKLGDAIEVSMASGAVQDSSVNSIATLTSPKSTTVIDNVAPTLSNVIVEDGGNITLTFSEAIVSPVSSKFSVTTGTHSIAISNFLMQGDRGATLQVTLAGKGGNVVTVAMSEGAIQDNAGNDNILQSHDSEYRIITTEAELVAIKNNPSDNFKLLNDIVLATVYSSSIIDATFSGDFDGNNKTISNMNINIPALSFYSKMAMFSSVQTGASGTTAKITDLTIELGTSLEVASDGGWSQIGILVGLLVGKGTLIIDNVHINNPHDTTYNITGTNYNFFGVFVGGSGYDLSLNIANSSIRGFKLQTGGKGLFGTVIGNSQADIVMTNSYIKDANINSNHIGGGVIGTMGYGSLAMTDSYIIADLYSGTETATATLGLIVGQLSGSDEKPVNLTRVWVESAASNTQLVKNGNATSTANVYSNVARGTGTGSAAKHTLSGTTLPTGFSSSVWEIKTSGARPTLKNNPE